MVSGDTGPTHIAAAVGTPIVGIYGPTRPARNGPWSPDDVTVSRDARLPVSSPAPLQAASGCACSTSRSTKCWRRSSGGSPRGAAVAEPSIRACCELLARLRVPLGFVFGVARALARAADAATLAGGHCRSRSSARRCASGRPAISNKSREVTASGPVSLVRASALRRVVGHGRRASRSRRTASRSRRSSPSYLAVDADGGDQERGSVSAADVRRSVRSLSPRRTACVDRRRGAFSLRAGDGQPRVSRGRRPRAWPCCCSSGRQRIMDRSGGTAGAVLVRPGG